MFGNEVLIFRHCTSACYFGFCQAAILVACECEDTRFDSESIHFDDFQNYGTVALEDVTVTAFTDTVTRAL
jgi:hypothetical protein